MKAVKAKLSESKPDRVAEFEKGAAAYAKKIVANFKDFEFVRSPPHDAIRLFIFPSLVYW